MIKLPKHLYQRIEHACHDLQARWPENIKSFAIEEPYYDNKVFLLEQRHLIMWAESANEMVETRLWRDIMYCLNWLDSALPKNRA